jgi:hypothetical protein
LVVSTAPSVKISSHTPWIRWIAPITSLILLRHGVSNGSLLTQPKEMTLCPILTIWLKFCRLKRAKKCTLLTSRHLRESRLWPLWLAVSLATTHWLKSMCLLVDSRRITGQWTTLTLWVLEKKAWLIGVEGLTCYRNL